MEFGIDPAYGKDETVITTAAVDWKAGHMYQVGDVVRLSGFVNSAFGRDWPRRIRTMLSWIHERSPRAKRVVEWVLFAVNDSLDYLFDYTFGPKRYTLARVVDSNRVVIR